MEYKYVAVEVGELFEGWYNRLIAGGWKEFARIPEWGKGTTSVCIMRRVKDEGREMDLKTGELRVYYRCDLKVDPDLDVAIIEAVAKQRYKWQASVWDATNGVRDLAFTQDLKGLGRDLERMAMQEAPKDSTVDEAVTLGPATADGRLWTEHEIKSIVWRILEDVDRDGAGRRRR